MSTPQGKRTLSALLPIILALISDLFVAASASGAEWMWQHPVPQGNTLWSVVMADQSHGFAVGDWGTLMYTYDGGESWELQYEAITDNFRDVAVLDPVTAWAAGDNGMVIHTTNGGTGWLEQASGTSSGLNGVFFLDSANGWICGDQRTIRRTTDGGMSWTAQTVPMGGGNSGVNDIFFTSLNEGWALGSGGALWRTTDGGALWTLHSTLGFSGLCIEFLDAATGFVVGTGGGIARTTNGGISWSPVISGTTVGLNDILFSGPAEFWIAGDNAILLHSTTGGTGWTIDSLSTYAAVNGIDAAGASLVVVGEYGLAATRVPPGPWSYSNRGTNVSANWVTFADPENGITVGQYGAIMRTTNSGLVWEEIQNGITGDSFYGAEMIGSDRVWVVGDGGILLHSSNGGVSWMQQSTNTFNTLLSVSFVNQNLGWAVGDLGTLLKTVNGGALWSGIPTSYPTSILFGVKFKDAVNGWIVGDGGIILRTGNGGSNWTPQTSGVGSALFYVDFLDLATGFCAGAGGVILRTTNGGSTWLPMATGTTKTIYLVGGVSLSSLWAVGDSGLVLHSTDGGTSWASQFPKTGYDLFGLRVLSDSVAWLCGDNAAVLKTGGSLPLTSVSVSITQGWNMITNPVDRVPGGDSLHLLYPTTTSPYAFSFNPASGYAQTSVLENGAGYWAKFAGDQTALVIGSPLLSTVIAVGAGWNMVGGLSAPVVTSSVTSVPPGIVASDWFGYSSGYDPVTVLEPGRAYWVKTSAAGQLLLSGSLPQLSSVPVMPAGGQIGGGIPELREPPPAVRGKGKRGRM